MSWILYSDITVDLHHCNIKSKDTEDTTESNEGNNKNSLPSQVVLKKTIGELNIESGSIIGFTLHSVKSEDGCDIDIG